MKGEREEFVKGWITKLLSQEIKLFSVRKTGTQVKGETTGMSGLGIGWQAGELVLKPFAQTAGKLDL